ncbi:MAG TPA: hypothetical protein VHQ64_06830 [Pyrinomonadaceae bacterium]|jgi:hypothetical protein|nr:hypothetical protein [Pyrinomonadaceae bacterium]
MSRIKRYSLPVFIGVVLGGVVYFALFPKKTPQAKGQTPPAPEVMSCVKNVKVTNRRIDEASDKLIVEIENTSSLGIVAISLESKKGNDGYTVRASTFEADDLQFIVKPHERYELGMELTNIPANANLQIGSVVYSDGTEDGCAASVEATRKAKAYHQQLKAQRKGTQ